MRNCAEKGRRAQNCTATVLTFLWWGITLHKTSCNLQGNLSSWFLENTKVCLPEASALVSISASLVFCLSQLFFSCLSSKWLQERMVCSLELLGCRAECCLGPLDRFGQDGQVCIPSPLCWVKALFWWWPPPKLLLAFFAHNTWQERHSWGEQSTQGRRALGSGMVCVWAARSQSIHAGRQNCFSSQTSDAWQWDLSSTSVQVQPAFVPRAPPRPLFHTVGGFSLWALWDGFGWGGECSKQ